jgi:TonB family protein
MFKATLVLALAVAPAALAQDHPLAEPDWKVIPATGTRLPPPKTVASPDRQAGSDDDDDSDQPVVGGPPPHVIRNPDWVAKPNANDLGSAYPRHAMLNQITGQAKITCVVTAAGALEGCRVVGEAPPGFGFGEAAVAMSPRFRMRPMTVDGKPVGGAKITIPINFFIPQWGSNLFGVVWQSAPSVAQVAAAYPPQARAAKIAGQVVLNCAIHEGFSLANCAVAAETPHGYGFDRAAKALAADFVAPSVDSGGVSTKGDRTQLTIAFTPGVLDPHQPAIGKPWWQRVPRALDLASSFPTQAIAAHVTEGRVTIACDVVSDGKLDHCGIVKEQPEGLGFGAAALSLSSQFQMSLWTDEGQPTIGGRINVPIRYLAPGVPLAAATPEPPPPPPQPAAAEEPHWARKPIPADFAAAYPPVAANLGLSGEVSIHCGVGDDGRLKACKVLSETPPGFGFGQAALTLAGGYRAPVGLASGAPPGEITFPIRFSMPKS